jgi:predicted ABC-type ATPase
MVIGAYFLQYKKGLGDPKLNIERVAIRVRNGGHHIPTDDIMHRHHTLIQNLVDHLHLMDNLLVVDNSTLNGKIVLEAENGAIKLQDNTLPQWVLPIRNKFK